MKKSLFRYKPIDAWVRGAFVATASVLAIAAE